MERRSYLAYKDNLLLLYEIQNTGQIAERTVAVPPHRPCTYGIVKYYLVRSYRIFWGAEAAGVKSP